MTKIVSLLFAILALESWIHAKEMKSSKSSVPQTTEIIGDKNCNGQQEFLALGNSKARGESRGTMCTKHLTP